MRIARFMLWVAYINLAVLILGAVANAAGLAVAP